MSSGFSHAIQHSKQNFLGHEAFRQPLPHRLGLASFSSGVPGAEGRTPCQTHTHRACGDGRGGGGNSLPVSCFLRWLRAPWPGFVASPPHSQRWLGQAPPTRSFCLATRPDVTLTTGPLSCLYRSPKPRVGAPPVWNQIYLSLHPAGIWEAGQGELCLNHWEGFVCLRSWKTETSA